MAYIQPDTTLQFLNVPFDPEYENTMYWSSLNEQNTYMESKVLLTIGNNSYQRKTKGVIRVGITPVVEGQTISTISNANYIRFKNTRYENKWFYAFVKRVEYINNNTVDVFYEIDVMQTWALDYTLMQCLIERQHVQSDLIGEHTIPESLEHGEYFDERLTVSAGDQIGSNRFEYTPAVVLVTSFDSLGNYAAGGMVQGRIPMGNYYTGLHYYAWQLTAENATLINQTLEAISGNIDIITKDGVKVPRFLADGVVAIFMMPWEFAQQLGAGGFVAPKVMRFDIRKNGEYKIGNYIPRNKKLLTYPYNFIYVTNNQGNTAEYKWEDFSNPLNAQLNVWGNASPNPAMFLVPYDYKGYTNDNSDEMIQVTGFPGVSWSYDAYKAWVAQNQGTLMSVGAGLVAGWVSALAPMVMGGSAGLSASTALSTVTQTYPQMQSNDAGISLPSMGVLSATLATMAQIHDHKIKPPTANGNGNMNLNYQAGYLTFHYYRKHIKEEYARIIDQYFDMYGYKVNRVGTPIRNARPCYTYVKTVGCVVDGFLPAEDAKKIEIIFDKGIRFWKPSAVFGVYSPATNNNELEISGLKHE